MVFSSCEILDSHPARNRRRVVFGLVSAVLATTLALLLGEAWVRWCCPIDDTDWYELHDDPVLFYRFASDKAGEDHGARRTQTSQRLRGPSLYALDPPAGVRRVLWIGDSACFGHGVGDEQTAAFEFCRQAKAFGLDVESINLGVVGYNVRQVREVMTRRSSEFRGTDTVVYLHHENDIINVPWAAIAAHLPSGLFWDYEPPQPLYRKLLKRSALVRRVWNSTAVVSLLGPAEGNVFDPALASKLLGDRTLEAPIHPLTQRCATLYDESTRHGMQFRDELGRMAEHCRAMRARFVFVYWPSRTLLHRLELSRLRTVLARWCHELDIAFVDATDAFLATPAPDLYFDAVHPGAAGYRLISRLVAERLYDTADESLGKTQPDGSD